MTDPLLPPELERQIFLCALNNSRQDVQNLLSVAERVQTWLIPALYEVVAFHSEYWTPFPFTKERYERYGKEARHLLVGTDDMIPYLSLFPNVTNLALWTGNDESLLGILEQLPLTRLSTTLHTFNPPTSALIRTFSNITHLEIVGGLDHERDCLQLLRHFTSLTHLCVLWEFNDEDLKKILTCHPSTSLKVLILWDSTNNLKDDDPTVGLSPLDLRDRELDDIRVVALEYNIIKDWENGARGDMDMWIFAENVVAERRLESIRN
ncbi:hypothetical protein BDN72DRAFT_963888 [Pluteus cervinus]|uniref:Uncharacterized protein n=1 Tax=Pluteus cervinus TaxID=181527 RepID=A0ACD3ACP1_9AGAR|nr:hypothetical protein BDN72DRAFT_963888 [Pluteus cervinus]